MLRKLGILSVTLGLVMALGALGWLFFNQIEEQQAGVEARAALEQVASAIDSGQRDEVGSESGSESGHAETAESGPIEMATLTIDGYTYIGYLYIPEIGLELPVQSDGALELLKKSPGRYLGSIPGGDLIISGHNYKDHFGPLTRVSVGGRVIFIDVEGKEYDYVVTEILTVRGADSPKMISGSEQWDLTLFTCTRGGQNRLTLRCILEGQRF